MSSAATTAAASRETSPRFRTWPITSVRSLEGELREMGLRVPADRVDGTGGDGGKEGCLSDALVSVGPAGRGGTGSFVSEDGLILTNWHVAYDAVRQASLSDAADGRDFVEEGFVARSRDEELRDNNYEVWITKSCEDVSARVLSAVEGVADPFARADKIRDATQEIALSAQNANEGDPSGRRCDVQEMLPNESYVLFTYERLRDVRVVYAPPKALGNFGGDKDNFEWPRHTADFTLLRAYASKDGTAAEYSPDNVPYRPKARLRVNPNGASPGDFVFLLGFPGSTMRYAPSPRLRFNDEVAVPNMVTDFSRKLRLIDEHETHSPEAALKLGKSKKSLANELKRSRGKLVMMRKLGLVEERTAEEDQLCRDAPEARAALDRLGEIYDDLRERDVVSTALEACRGVYAGSALLALGHALHEYVAVESARPDDARETAYRVRNRPFLAQRLAKRVADVHVPHEVDLILDAKRALRGTDELETLGATLENVLGDDRETITNAVRDSALVGLDRKGLEKLFRIGGDNDDESSSSTVDRSLLDDPFLECAAALWPAYSRERDVTKALLSERDELFARLLDHQRRASREETFYPDCNGSLRLSAGRVEGYRAADAVDHKPRTTLAGLWDKAVEADLGSGDPCFACPDRLRRALDDDADDARSVPVCLLYSTDTVGGNSGSPVMNADGEFVAINFDRQRQGLMNEFKWSKDYSRSIGVDVKYILWLVGEYDGAKDLVNEMLS